VIGGSNAVNEPVHRSIALAAGWNGSGNNPTARVAGSDRYQTAAAVADRVRQLASRPGAVPLPDSYRTVLITTGENFPDALSAGTLAYRGGHLLLLAQTNNLPLITSSTITSLGANCATVVGGFSVLSSKVQSDVNRALGSSPSNCDGQRIAGSNRYETAELIANEILRRHTRPGEQVKAILASGTNFADALADSTLAHDSIILLTSSNHLPAATRNWVLTKPDRIDAMLVIGGSRAISPAIAIEANNPKPRLLSTPTAPKPTLGQIPKEANHDRCRIPQNLSSDPSTYAGRHSVAFPVDFENLPSTGEIRLLTIPIDWSDFPAEIKDLDEKHEHVKVFMDYYEQTSGGRLKFIPQFGARWYRMPEPISSYPQSQSSDFNSKLAQHAVDAVDLEVDFSRVDIVIFVFPDFPPIPVSGPFPFASTQHFNRGGSRGDDPRWIFSQEGFVRNYAGGANFFDHRLRPVWSYYVHEVAHMFNLPDWYMREANTTNSEFLPDLDYAIGPMSNWGVMSSQDGPSRTFVAWDRWLMGWLSGPQVICYELADVLNSAPFELELVGLDVNELGVKAVMIRTGPHAGLVIESRRPVFPDHDLVYLEPFGRIPAGLIVYRVDATKGNSEGTLTLVPPEGQGIIPVQLSDRFDRRMIDALFNKGAVGYAEGLKIELIYSGATDIVRISGR
jgi:M6 family metalloprotease-like protein